MYIKVINPTTHGKSAYSNQGSARQATNYLEGEAKKIGEQATFFTGNQTGLSGNEAVALLDNNRRGLRVNEAKFYSLVISPSAEELAHIGNDSSKLQAYTRDVMRAYAENFSLKEGGRKLAETDLVWVATQHNERVARGTDELPSGTKKEGLQTHIHLMVSARDREQKLTLNPLGSTARFNRVNFMAASNLIFEQKFEYEKASFAKLPKARVHREKPTKEEIEHRAASIRKRASRTLSPEQQIARDKRLKAQVKRINEKLLPDEKLTFSAVQQAAREQQYSKVFYSRLGRINRELTAGNSIKDPYYYLQNGRHKSVEEAFTGGIANQVRATVWAKSGAVMPSHKDQHQSAARPIGGRTLSNSLLQSADKAAGTLAPQSYSQDVRGDWERD